jgi:DNA-binding PadR family transcriptional regulator
MGERGFNRQWAREFESRFGQRHGGDWGGRWGSWQWGPAQRPSGPPPWLAGLFGLAGQETAQPRGPRVRRGDVRVAILDVLAEEPLNGYQIIGQIADRTNGAWRPSPGSVYPTISQLEDEGLVESDDERGRRTLRLSEAGRDYLATHEEEVAEVWAPFAGESRRADPETGDEWDFAALKPELGRVMNAVWQIITTGSDRQRREAVGVLVEARRSLYTILADDPGDVRDEGDDASDGSEGDEDDRAEGAE